MAQRLPQEKQVPANEKLWDMLVARARAKFNVYPSPAASHWIHAQYVHLGGRFVKSLKEVPKENKRDKDKEKTKKRGED